MSGYSADWGGPLDMWEEKQKECDFKTARIKLLERDLETMRQNMVMYRDRCGQLKGELEAVGNQLERERGCDWAGFDGGMNE